MKIQLKNGQVIECTAEEYIQVRKMLTTEKKQPIKTETISKPIQKVSYHRKKWNLFTDEENTIIKKNINKTASWLRRHGLHNHSRTSINTQKTRIRYPEKYGKIVKIDGRQNYLRKVNKIAIKTKIKHPNLSRSECMKIAHRVMKVKS